MRSRILISAIGLFVFAAATLPANCARSTKSAPSAATHRAPRRASGATKTVELPILVYHIVRPSRAGDSAAVRAMAQTPETFDAQLAHLKESGYHAVGFHDLEAYFSSNTPLPAKPIIISFDDGWADQYRYAVPILQKYHDTATFFVTTNAIGHTSFLSWQNLKALIAAGMTIGDHSRSHPYLARIANAQRLWDEIHGSKEALEKELGVPVTEFAYPYGQYDRAIVALVQKAGFLSARADVWRGSAQSADQLYELSALNAPTTLSGFVKRLP